jgi:hypothetical protein
VRNALKKARNNIYDVDGWDLNFRPYAMELETQPIELGEDFV